LVTICAVCKTLILEDDETCVQPHEGVWIHSGPCRREWTEASDEQRLNWGIGAIRWREDSGPSPATGPNGGTTMAVPLLDDTHYLVVVKREEESLRLGLMNLLERVPNVDVISDRRVGDRRLAPTPVEVERRETERRLTSLTGPWLALLVPGNAGPSASSTAA
jgi:hypothetical protein